MTTVIACAALRPTPASSRALGTAFTTSIPAASPAINKGTPSVHVMRMAFDSPDWRAGRDGDQQNGRDFHLSRIDLCQFEMTDRHQREEIGGLTTLLPGRLRGSS